MSIIHRFRSSTVALSVCALLTCALACTPGAAAARSGADKAAALAQERYYSSYGRRTAPTPGFWPPWRRSATTPRTARQSR